MKPGVKPGSLWAFANRVYAVPQVETITRQLQDQYHANINIILWCCWLVAASLRLSSSWLDDVLINIDTVSQMTVNKLREVRSLLKESEKFSKVQTQSISKHILTAELMVEKVLLNRLQDLTQRFVEADKTRVESFDNLPMSLYYYLSFLNIPEAKKYAQSIRLACRRRELVRPDVVSSESTV